MKCWIFDVGIAFGGRGRGGDARDVGEVDIYCTYVLRLTGITTAESAVGVGKKKS